MFFQEIVAIEAHQGWNVTNQWVCLQRKARRDMTPWPYDSIPIEFDKHVE